MAVAPKWLPFFIMDFEGRDYFSDDVVLWVCKDLGGVGRERFAIMVNQNLFLPVCVPILSLFIIVMMVIGIRARIRYAKDIFNRYKKRQKPH